MAKSNLVRLASVRVHSAYLAGSAMCRQALVTRLDYRDERGDVAPRTVGIAVMAALAISVGAIITVKVTNKAASIPLP